ncbi:MAG: PD-(D/E)XK nuclease family protein, partial [Saezia sp.]
MPDFPTPNTLSYSSAFSKTQDSWPLVVDHGMSFWKLVALKISNWCQTQEITPLHLTVVVPFVQLIAPLRYAWGQIAGDGFLPRIETTQTWSVRVGGVHEVGTGPSMDVVLDRLQARHWLEQLAHQQSIALADALVEPLVLMATDLVRAAAAVPTKKRADYWLKAEEVAGRIPAGVAGVEAALGPLAVAWAQATEQWATDILFELAENAHQQKKGLVVIQAGGEDLLTANLYQQWAQHSRLWLDLDTFAKPSSPEVPTRPQQGDLFNEEPFKQADFYQDALDLSAADPLQQIAKMHPPQWIIAKDAEDEAELAASEVIRLLNQGVMPVALCSQDRPIARRVWALLQRERIALADETGWTLSTTRCAALVMGLVNAALPNAAPDDVLDAFKGLPPESFFVQGLDALEQHLRAKGIVQWPKKASSPWENVLSQTLDRVNFVLSGLYADVQKTLWAHLHALNQALKTSTAWSVLIADEAGREIMQLLHLHELGSFTEVEEGISAVSDFIPKAQQVRMSYEDFAHWVNSTLESMTFIPVRPQAPQVVLMPLARVMLRPFAAVVIPGCDDTRLTAQPSLPGFWSEADRIALGLMNQSLWWTRLQAQWTQALRLPRVVLIWRNAEGSQPLGPATLVQRVLPDQAAMADQRELVQQTPQPTWVPAPKPAKQFPVQRLSASAYKKLRDCPYKFYAEYLLQLNKEDELETELSRRDYGNWLHAVLRQFHLKRTHAY